MLGPEFETGALPSFEGWTVVEKLGEGGMCAVYRAHPDHGRGPERAIKLLTDKGANASQRFSAEAQMLQAIDHPCVVKVHHLERDAKPPWIVMDLLHGRDFEERRQTDGPMEPELAARLFADLANGLATVHDLGVRHRDIKPANIILCDDGVARLIDFGIARVTSDAHLTQQGFVVGTAAYLPPEIFVEDDAQEIQDSESADVYALGQTLHEVLIGASAHPSDKGTQATLLVQIMRDKLERPYLDPRVEQPQVPKGLAKVVQRATAQDPADRLQTAAELEQALRRWLKTRTSAAREAPISLVDPLDLPAPPVTGKVPVHTDLAALAGGGDTLEPLDTQEQTDSVARGSTAPARRSPVQASDDTLAPGRPVRERPPATTPAPAPAPPTAPSTSLLPAMLRTAVAGVLGLGGMSVLAIGLGAVMLVGLAVLFLLRPVSPMGEVEAVVQARWQDLAGCRRDEDGDLLLSLTVVGGDAKTVKVIESDLPKRVDSCVRKVMSKADYPEHREAYTVEVPIHFE